MPLKYDPSKQRKQLLKTPKVNHTMQALSLSSVRRFSITEGKKNQKQTRRGRPSISPRERQSIMNCRQIGLTLLATAIVTGHSMSTVMKYSAAIPNARRHNKPITVNRRTGLAV